MQITVILCLALITLVSASSVDFLAQSAFLSRSNGNDPKSNLQNIFDGVWEYGNLTDPKQAINCFDEDTANLTLIFIGDSLKEIAKSDAVDFITTVQAFQKAFPQNVLDCLSNDQEILDLRDAYNVSEIPAVVLQASIEKYIVTHVTTLHSQASTGYFYYFQGQWTPLGTLFGQIAQAIINSTSAQNDAIVFATSTPDDPLTDLQSLFNGLFEQVGLQDPTTIINCYNETTAQITLDFAQDVIGDLADDNYLALIREYQTYKESLTPNVTDCLKNNDEWHAVYNAYGFQNETSDTLIKKYVNFALKHHFQLLNDTKTAENDFAAGDYHAAGLATGDLFQKILDNSTSALSRDETIRDIKNYATERFGQYVIDYGMNQ